MPRQTPKPSIIEIGGETYFNEAEVCKQLCVTPTTLSNYRKKGLGPAWHRIANRVIYSLTDLKQYAANCRVPTEDQA